MLKVCTDSKWLVRHLNIPGVIDQASSGFKDENGHDLQIM